MKKIIIGIMLVLGAVSFSAKKDKAAPEMPDINAQMEKADKIATNWKPSDSLFK